MERDNNFGALRLLFAGLVIVAHSPEMLDGSQSREPLYAIFGTLTFGRLAVDAFFLISGYLISNSFVNSGGIRSYFLRRTIRIYPAFLVCSLVCIFLVAPFAGGDLYSLSIKDWLKNIFRILFLTIPEIQGVFEGQHYPSLNGAAWTIIYEFRCYILAAIFGVFGLYRRRRWYLFITIILFIINIFCRSYFPSASTLPGWVVFAVGDPIQSVRLISAFMIGACFWLYRDKVVYSTPIIVAVIPITIALMFSPLLAESALILGGGYVLFWTAFKIDWRPLRTINAKDDISYGLYLYGWPIAALIIWYWPDIPVMLLGILTYISATSAGVLSWFIIEKPMMHIRFLQVISKR